jgi:uncharacterized membrane protein (DUF4010 family)
MEEDITALTTPMKDLLVRLAIAAGIGFLVGLEREFSKKTKEKQELFAGVRTYPLFAIFGYLSAFLSLQFGMWVFGVALAGLIAFVIVSYLQEAKAGGGIGGTSEMSVVLTFVLGAVVFTGYILLALVITVIVLLLLTFKPSLHRFAKGLTTEELRAFIQFIIISALVIPFLPDESFGPYDSWNLKDIWKMVILVSGISLAGYLLSKILGNKGTILAGIVGGLASSTAVALSFSRRSKEDPSTPAFFYAMGIIAASTIMFPRVLLEVYALNRPLFMDLWIPVAIITAAGFSAAFLIYKTTSEKRDTGEMTLENPLNFGVAIKFALVYAAILWFVKFASDQFGTSGTYIASIISGVTDVDAITISMAKMARGSENNDLAVNSILLATLSNTTVKLIIALSVGSASLRKTVLMGFGAIFITGLGFLAWKFLL